MYSYYAKSYEEFAHMSMKIFFLQFRERLGNSQQELRMYPHFAITAS